MAEEHYEIDLEMMMDFIDESLESFAPIPSLFVEFEANPDDLKLIEAIFRPVHSLKGNAAYFGLMKIKNLAHDLESVLDLLRKSKLMPSSEIIDGLLAGIDEMQGILEVVRAEADGKERVKDTYESVLERVRGLAEDAGARPPERQTVATEHTDTWLELYEGLEGLKKNPRLEGTDEALQLEYLIELLETVAPVDLEKPADSDAGVDLAMAANPLEALMAVLTNPPADKSPDQQAALVQALLQQVKECCSSPTAADMVTTAMEEFDLFVSKIGYDPMLVESLVETAQKLAGMQDWNTVPAEEETEPEPLPETEPEPVVEKVEAEVVPVETQPAARSARKEKDSGRTMRVSEEAIDNFLGFVGELIAVDEMFRYIHAEMVKFQADLTLTTDLLRVINTFTKLSDDLQNSIMEIRKVSVKPMLGKSQRIVRDIATSANKKIETSLEGEDTLIDRSLIETLEAPMVHMVRNAADHGIELPEERMAVGKRDTGLIRVAMTESEEDIILSIKDDGKGFEYEKIRAKAVNMGIIQEGAEMDERDLANVVFAPGFSTAEKVTDVSGRGVGMDAVKRAVEEAGGAIEIFSEQGLGTEFRIRLPKSIGTQIINSFVVQLGEERFVLPMEKVSGSFKADAESLHRLPNGAVCVRRNESVLPVICMDGAYYGEPEPLGEGILITIESNPRFVFYVDTILGIQKVVVRAVPWIRTQKFLGAAVMGDGRVSMIVNIDSLGQYAT
ncbi:MAG: chemotaxis protein CheA [Acidobacteriota bacterium]|nr:chemotaxis protein CheA [Acidobacteriota bacterium]